MPPLGGACSSDMLAVVAHERFSAKSEEASSFVRVRYALKWPATACLAVGRWCSGIEGRGKNNNRTESEIGQ